MSVVRPLGCVLGLIVLPGMMLFARDEKKAAEPDQPSYYKHIRPILIQHCQGCHQPAKPQGQYVLTTYADMLKPGERMKTGIIPGNADESGLVDQITPHDGKPPKMPKGHDPLSDADVRLIKKWIAQGAKDDTPALAKLVVDAQHPPIYALPPVIPSVQFSPDGHLLAVAGYHEVFIHKADGSGLLARLVGLSERVQSLAFSPDGETLAVVGGSPGRFGEIQLWEIKQKIRDASGFALGGAEAVLASKVGAPGGLVDAVYVAGNGLRQHPAFGQLATGEIVSTKLKLSVTMTYDTLYGVSWSRDGTRLAFGCADNTVRAIDAKTGQQVLFQGSHGDWVLGTVFSTDDHYLASVSRDMSVRLTEVETQRFIDNITSITPGALKGGLQAVDCRPNVARRMVKVPLEAGASELKRYDELIIGGHDGVPRLYKMHRETKRVIGDDACKIREYEALPGRIFALSFSPDGTHFAAGSSSDGKGEARVYQVNDAKRVATLEGQKGAVYTLSYRLDGRVIASAGFDGVVRLNDALTGKLIKEFTPAPLSAASASR